MILFRPRSMLGEEIEIKQAGSSEVKRQERKYEYLALVLGSALAVGLALAYQFFQDIILVVLGILGTAILASIIGFSRTVASIVGVFSFFRWMNRKDK